MPMLIVLMMLMMLMYRHRGLRLLLSLLLAVAVVARERGRRGGVQRKRLKILHRQTERVSLRPERQRKSGMWSLRTQRRRWRRRMMIHPLLKSAPSACCRTRWDST
jgi:hypothetical protein